MIPCKTKEVGKPPCTCQDAMLLLESAFSEFIEASPLISNRPPSQGSCVAHGCEVRSSVSDSRTQLLELYGCHQINICPIVCLEVTCSPCLVSPISHIIENYSAGSILLSARSKFDSSKSFPAELGPRPVHRSSVVSSKFKFQITFYPHAACGVHAFRNFDDSTKILLRAEIIS